MTKDLTRGNLITIMLQFSVPYLIASFLQSFYGMADLFITGQFNGAATISAVSIGSQIMHMLTVMIVGLAMGATVMISRGVGSGDQKMISKSIGNAVVLFVGIAAAATILCLLGARGFVAVLSTPKEAVSETLTYVRICFTGIPFIVAYNVIASIFRGLGDTRSPMYYVAIAGVINIIGDYILIGPLGMGASGAAIATVASQAISVVIALIALTRGQSALHVTRQDFRIEQDSIMKILAIGVPIAFQDGLIQISFLVITAIANARGVDVAAAVGIVEKIISFLFLVPSAMLSTVSAVAAQNAGAGKHDRSKKALKLGILICIGFGAIVFVVCQIVPSQIVGAFVSDDSKVVTLGAEYLQAYALDCMIAGVHFCFSGYFSAYGKSLYSFIHNMTSVILVRIPGAYLASVLFPATLFPMGLAAPMGSLLSVIICAAIFYHNRNRWSQFV